MGNLPARARRGHADGNFELQGDFCGVWGIYGAKGPFSLVGIGLCEGGACAVWSLPNRVTGPRARAAGIRIAVLSSVDSSVCSCLFDLARKSVASGRGCLGLFTVSFWFLFFIQYGCTGSSLRSFCTYTLIVYVVFLYGQCGARGLCHVRCGRSGGPYGRSLPLARGLGRLRAGLGRASAGLGFKDGVLARSGRGEVARWRGFGVHRGAARGAGLSGSAHLCFPAMFLLCKKSRNVGGQKDDEKQVRALLDRVEVGPARLHARAGAALSGESGARRRGVGVC